MRASISQTSTCAFKALCSDFLRHPQYMIKSIRSFGAFARRSVSSCYNWTLVKPLSTMFWTKPYCAMTPHGRRTQPQQRPPQPKSPHKPRHQRHLHPCPPSSVHAATNPATLFSSVLYAASSATPWHMSWPTANTTCCREHTRRHPPYCLCMGEPQDFRFQRQYHDPRPRLRPWHRQALRPAELAAGLERWGTAAPPVALPTAPPLPTLHPRPRWASVVFDATNQGTSTRIAHSYHLRMRPQST